VRYQAQDEAAQNEQHRVRQTGLSGDDVERRDHHQQQTDQLNLDHAATIKKAEGKRKKEEPRPHADNAADGRSRRPKEERGISASVQLLPSLDLEVAHPSALDA
jgi:hypothetical protein